MGALLEHFPDQTGFFIGLNVFEPLQDFPHDLQIMRSLADCALALRACDGANPAISEHFLGQEFSARLGLDLWNRSMLLGVVPEKPLQLAGTLLILDDFQW